MDKPQNVGQIYPSQRQEQCENCTLFGYIQYIWDYKKKTFLAVG